ncbi:MAG TPA: 3,4-dihydroxy-2-butanone-4-phosphate synthase [Faecalibacter sp.]
MSTRSSQLNTIEEALEDLKQGKVIIVVDDEDRENEGDFLCTAQSATPEVINFMATHGRGLICAPLTQERCKKLGLDLMVGHNTAIYETNFTVSVDLQGHGCTTGISASDRSKTVQALIDDSIDPDELGRPGHIFPLIAKDGGVLVRMGHTEAAVDLARLAGHYPAGCIVEILKEDGEMARLPQLLEIAKEFNLKIISIEDLIAYRLKHDNLIERIDEFPAKTTFGEFNLVAYKQTNNAQVHFALTKGEWTENDVVPVRVKSSNNYYDLFAALQNGETPLLEKTAKLIDEAGKGAIIFINNIQDGDLVQTKLDMFKKYSNGSAETAILPEDEKNHGIGSQIIKDLGIKRMNVITRKISEEPHTTQYGLEIVDYTQL